MSVEIRPLPVACKVPVCNRRQVVAVYRDRQLIGRFCKRHGEFYANKIRDEEQAARMQRRPRPGTLT